MQLGQTQYLKTYMNGRWEYTTAPYDGNVPQGTIQLSREQWGKEIKAEAARRLKQNAADIAAGKTTATYNQNEGIFKLAKDFQAGKGQFAKDYVAPGYENFQPNAPTPSVEYGTPEYQAKIAQEKANFANVQPGVATSTVATPESMPNQPVSVRRDNQNNFYATDAQGNERKLTLPEFQSLGINADFVPAGSSVSFNQATTGQGSKQTPTQPPSTPTATAPTTTQPTATQTNTQTPQSTEQLSSPSGVTQIYRDNNNNFFSVDAQGNHTPIDLNQFKALGLNEKFVQPGQTVSLKQAQTGTVTSQPVYVRQQGTQDVYDISSGNPVKVSYQDAMKNDIWSQVKDVPDVNTAATTLANTPQKTPEDIKTTLQNMGFTQDQINALNPDQLAMLGSISDIAKQSYANGTGITLNDAINYAKNDPTISAKYADALNIDKSNFNNYLQNLQTQTNTEAQNQAIQFKNEQRALQESEANAGRAYSGYRQQAKQQLGTSESGIVTSTKSRLQQNLRNLGTSFENKYGTKATPSGGVSYLNPLTGTPETLSTQTVGGITGTQPLAQKQDVLKKASQVYSLGQVPQL